MNREQQKIRAAIDNEVIRAVAALRQQRTVAREQDGQTTFVSGTEAAREYLIETLERAFEAGDATPPATPEPPKPGEFDAVKWAESFAAHVQWKPSIATDEGTMITWFASAIMAGYDEAMRRSQSPAASGDVERPETGPMVFGDDWPGVFVRGDNAAGIVATLMSVMSTVEKVQPMAAVQLRSIMRLFNSCDVRTTGTLPQRAVLAGDHPTPGGTK